MSRWLRMVGLIVALLAAQLVFATHGIGHPDDLDHESGEVCVQCLALAGAASAPPPADAAPAHFESGASVPIGGVSPRLTFSRCTYFRSRAPPARQS